MTRRRSDAGFTLVEILVAFLILATTIMALKIVADKALRSSMESNRLRAARMLLALKTEEVMAGIEEAPSGDFEGYPGFSWEVTEELVPIDTGGAADATVAGSSSAGEQVRIVTVTVRYPTMKRTDAYDTYPSDEPERTGVTLVHRERDAPGELRVTVMLDPEDAELKPAPRNTGGGGQRP